MGSAASVHIGQWADQLSRRGHSVLLATAHDPPSGEPIADDVEVVRLRPNAPAGYLLASRSLAKALRHFRPDVVQAHYITGYGTLARLTRHRPLVMSVWGQDVFEFPDRSTFHRALVRSNLRRADRVTSTSEVMRRRVLEVLATRPVRVDVVSFGVDPARFAPRLGARPPGPFRFGTVKWLEDKYGIDDLLRAAALVAEAGVEFEVVIAGDGSARPRLESLASELSLDDRVRFVGRIPHAMVPDFLRQLDAYVSLSVADSESFGVAAVEAGSCGLPVVVSDAGGLPEVVLDGLTGFVVQRRDPAAAAVKLVALAHDEALRVALGTSARAHVEATYSWERCVERLDQVLDEVVDGANRRRER